jgi:branched-subunit amino acid aminotransferase/4-amino-4-deoxychorismate lyase
VARTDVNPVFMPRRSELPVWRITERVFGRCRIGLNPADEYTLLIMVIPVGDYYKGGLSPVSAVVIQDYDRAAPKGVGHVKV